MSRVPLVQKEQASPELKEIYDKIEARGAKIHNAHKALAHNPDILRNFLRLGVSLLTKTELPAKLRELAILRIARLTRSDYEWASHYPIALEIGVSQDQVDAISHWSDATNFSDEERAVLQYTDEVAQNSEVTDETFRVLQQYLNEQGIVELTLLVGFYRMVARFVMTLQIEVDTDREGSVQDLLGRNNWTQTKS